MAFEQQKHFIEGMKYPLAERALCTPPIPCEFKVGESVTFTNEYGVVFQHRTVTGFSPTVEHDRFVFFDNSAWWFPASPASLTRTAVAADEAAIHNS